MGGVADPRRITDLLLAWGRGDERARDALMPLVYEELRQIAARQFGGEDAGHLWQPTALVHEAYERLIDQQAVRWQNRAHFYGVAALIMRRLLVDHARQRRAAKRGAGQTIVPLDEALVGAAAASAPTAIDILELDDALSRLAAIDPRPARVVELRYFVGLSVEEVAEVLRVSPATVKREWAVARAWLRRDLFTEGAG
jgi:RNA polymerase sigma factor (TIGR02999 family)